MNWLMNIVISIRIKFNMFLDRYVTFPFLHEKGPITHNVLTNMAQFVDVSVK